MRLLQAARIDRINLIAQDKVIEDIERKLSSNGTIITGYSPHILRFFSCYNPDIIGDKIVINTKNCSLDAYYVHKYFIDVHDTLCDSIKKYHNNSKYCLTFGDASIFAGGIVVYVYCPEHLRSKVLDLLESELEGFNYTRTDHIILTV